MIIVSFSVLLLCSFALRLLFPSHTFLIPNIMKPCTLSTLPALSAFSANTQVWLRGVLSGVLDPEATVSERALNMLLDALLVPASKLILYDKFIYLKCGNTIIEVGGLFFKAPGNIL